jgi:RNA polymerase sigma-70 factor (ECF subfamily)
MTEFEEIYAKHFRDVFRFIHKLSGDAVLAEEITQETFFKALKGIGGLKEKTGIKVWLFQIAKNTLYTHHRKRKRTEPLTDERVSGEKSLTELMTDKDSAMRIHTVIHNLKEPYKEVFTLRIFGELTFAQIGEIFDKTENWARVTFYRSRQKVLAEMEEQNE